MSKSRGILPPKRFWTAVEEQLLREHYADTPIEVLMQLFECPAARILAKANKMGLHKSAELIAQIARDRTNAPGHGSQRTRIKPGETPWNKGTHYQAGGRSAETQFKAGAKPHSWVPVGSYRMVDGALQRKINDNPGPNNVRWRNVHELVWIEANGPVPAGHLVVFKPGRRTLDPNLITLDAVECITRAENMLRNSLHRHGPEIASIHKLRGAIRRQINHQAKEADTP